MGIKLDKDSLAVEENGYLRKIVNVYIVYELDAWPRNPTKNFNFKSFILRATSVVKNKEKEKHVYMGYGIIFSSAGSWIFDNDTAKNVIIFSVDIFSCSSYQADNRKNKCLVLVKGFVLFLEKQVQNFAWICIIMLIIITCLLIENKSLRLKPTTKMLTCQVSFVLEAYLMDLVLLSLEKCL